MSLEYSAVVVDVVVVIVIVYNCNRLVSFDAAYAV